MADLHAYICCELFEKWKYYLKANCQSKNSQQACIYRELSINQDFIFLQKNSLLVLWSQGITAEILMKSEQYWILYWSWIGRKWKNRNSFQKFNITKSEKTQYFLYSHRRIVFNSWYLSMLSLTLKSWKGLSMTVKMWLTVLHLRKYFCLKTNMLYNLIVHIRQDWEASFSKHMFEKSTILYFYQYCG